MTTLITAAKETTGLPIDNFRVIYMVPTHYYPICALLAFIVSQREIKKQTKLRGNEVGFL